MKIDLTVHIADYINRFGHVVIPGIGKFTKIHLPAKLGDDIHTLTPPSTKLTFAPDEQEESENLATYIASQEEITAAQASQLLNLFAERKQHDIVQDGKATIYPLGTLMHDNSGISYQAADNRLINQYFGLQNITLEPVQYEDHDKAASAEKHQTESFESLITVDKSERDPLFRWLAIIVLAVLLAICYLKCDTVKDRLGFSSATTTADSSAQAVLASSTDSLDDMAVDSSTLAADVAPTNEGQQLLHIDEINDGQIDSVLADQDLRIASDQDVIECVIILGSYKGQRNAIRMMGMVEEQGHELYVGVHGDYTRVGITYNCAKQNLVSYLQQIRADLSEKAWYLTPELHVEYSS